jgi:hypothetical protein
MEHSLAELRRELERLADEARAHRARLSELGAKITTASELVATIRSTLRGDESTPAPGDAQDQVDAQEEAHAG